jgi:hypothetical protein
VRRKARNLHLATKPKQRDQKAISPPTPKKPVAAVVRKPEKVQSSRRKRSRAESLQVRESSLVASSPAAENPAKKVSRAEMKSRPRPRRSLPKIPNLLVRSPVVSLREVRNPGAARVGRRRQVISSLVVASSLVAEAREPSGLRGPLEAFRRALQQTRIRPGNLSRQRTRNGHRTFQSCLGKTRAEPPQPVTVTMAATKIMPVSPGMVSPGQWIPR